MAAPIHTNWTVEEYLAFEEQSEIRHEFMDGQVYAMAGASKRHNQIASAIQYSLYGQLVEKSCEVFQGDMRVHIAGKRYFYPDIVVVCGEDRYENDKETTLLNPTVLIEVLSPSTEDKDRGGKLWAYRNLPSLQEYWLFSQDQVLAEWLIRKGGRTWEFGESNDPDAVLQLPSIGCTLALSDIYRRVEFEEET